MTYQEAINILQVKGSGQEDIKVAYREAVKRWHPDINPDPFALEMAKLINLAYEFLKEHLGKWSHRDYAPEAGLDDVIWAIYQSIKHYPGIKIELCGTWLWISGDTRPVSDRLKGKGFKWSGNKMMWYWHPAGYRKKGKRSWSIDEIRSTWGSRNLDGETLSGIA